MKLAMMNHIEEMSSSGNKVTDSALIIDGVIHATFDKVRSLQ